MKKYLIILSVVFSLVADLEAKNGANEIIIRTTAPQVSDGDIPSLAVINPEGQAEPLDLPRYNISMPCRHGAGPSVLIYERDSLIEFLSAKTASKPQPLYELDMPSGVGSFLLVFEKRKKGAGMELYPRLIPDNSASFPAGSRLFVNLSSRALKGNIEELNFAVQKNGTQLVQVGLVPEGSLRKNIQLFAQYGEIFKPVASSRWTFSPGRRGLVVIFEDPASKSIRMIVMPDTIPVEK